MSEILKQIISKRKNALTILVLSIALILLVGTPTMAVFASTSLTFQTTNLSNDSAASTAPVVQTVGPNVYVAWADKPSSGAGYIAFVRSTNNGTNWGTVFDFIGKSGFKGNPNAKTSSVQMAAEGNYVFLTWEQGSATAFAYSSNNGSTFSYSIISGGAPAGKMSAQAVSASGSNVYVTYTDSLSNGSEYVLVQYSHDGGVTFSTPKPINLGTSGFSHGEDETAAEGNYVWVVWDLIWISRSIDGGVTWSTPTYLLPSSCVFPCIGREPMISVSGSHVYVTFPMGGFQGASSYSTMIAISSDYGATFAPAKNISSTLQGIREVQQTSYGSNVYVTTRGTNSSTVKGVQQYVYVSHDYGATFSTPYLLASLSGAENGFGGVAVYGNNVYVQWVHQVSKGGPQQVFFAASEDGGSTWSVAQQLTNSASGTVGYGDPSGGQGPMVAVSVYGYAYVVWIDNSFGNGDAFIGVGTLT